MSNNNQMKQQSSESNTRSWERRNAVDHGSNSVLVSGIKEYPARRDAFSTASGQHTGERRPHSQAVQAGTATELTEAQKQEFRQQGP